MRNVVIGLFLMVASAAVGASALDDPQAMPDPATRLVYRLDFGATGWSAQRLALRFDTGAPTARPALLEGALTAGGTRHFALNGVDLLAQDPSLAQAEGGVGAFFAKLTPTQWLGIGVATVTLGVVVAGGGGGGEPTINASGGN